MSKFTFEDSMGVYFCADLDIYPLILKGKSDEDIIATVKLDPEFVKARITQLKIWSVENALDGKHR